MIPLWMFPLALVCGNTFVLKPSERDPGATMLLCEMAHDAGVPKGVLNVIHGSRDGRERTVVIGWFLTSCFDSAVNFILDDPTIRAVSFVGSDVAVRMLIYFLLFRL